MHPDSRRSSCSVLRSARGALLPTALLLAACGGGGGGGGSTPDLQVGVDLSGAWELTSTVTAVSGNSCTDLVGDVSIDAFRLNHDRPQSRLLFDSGTAEEMVGTMNGVRATLRQQLSFGTATSTVDVELTFAPDGTTCTGTARSLEVDGPDRCDVSSRISGRRTVAMLLQSAHPPQGTYVCSDTSIRAQFSLPLDSASITTASFTLTGPNGPVAAAVGLAGDQTAELIPLSPLLDGEFYFARLTTAVRSDTGLAMGREVSWLFFTHDYAAEVFDSDPVAYWQLDETNGPAVSRVGGAAASGSLLGTVTRSRPGVHPNSRAVAFENGLMETTPEFAAALFPGRTVLAVEFWLRPDGERFYQYYCAAGRFSIMSLEGNATTPTFWVNNGFPVGTVSTPIGAWTHIVLQITGSHAQAWRNGELVLERPFTAALPTLTGGFRIGGETVNNFVSISTIDEVAIYHRALTATEIQKHYAVGRCQ